MNEYQHVDVSHSRYYVNNDDNNLLSQIITYVSICWYSKLNSFTQPKQTNFLYDQPKQMNLLYDDTRWTEPKKINLLYDDTRWVKKN